MSRHNTIHLNKRLGLVKLLYILNLILNYSEEGIEARELLKAKANKTLSRGIEKIIKSYGSKSKSEFLLNNFS